MANVFVRLLVVDDVEPVVVDLLNRELLALAMENDLVAPIAFDRFRVRFDAHHFAHLCSERFHSLVVVAAHQSDISEVLHVAFAKQSSADDLDNNRIAVRPFGAFGFAVIESKESQEIFHFETLSLACLLARHHSEPENTKSGVQPLTDVRGRFGLEADGELGFAFGLLLGMGFENKTIMSSPSLHV